MAQVTAQLASGEVRIVFDPEADSATLVTRHELQQR